METETYKIEWTGPYLPDYFPGAGTCGTPWDAVAVGSGSSIADAYDDAVEFAYQGELAPVVDLPEFRETGLPALEVEDPESESLFFVVIHYMEEDKEEKAREANIAAVEALWEGTYRDAFDKLLRSWGAYFAEEGWVVGEPCDISDEEYGTMLPVSLGGVECDLRLTLVESPAREGDDCLEGVAFSLDLGAPCGHVIGGICPGNYTEQLYILPHDAEALAERWNFFVNAENYEIEFILREHVTECPECKEGT